MINGQYLSIQMNGARMALVDFRKNHEVPLTQFDFQRFYKMELLQNQLGNGAPIAPFSIFNLSIKTFVATLATIITYIVILIRMRGME